MNSKQWAVLAVVSGIVVCILFIYLFKERLDKIVVILIGAALAFVVAEVISFIGRKYRR